MKNADYCYIARFTGSIPLADTSQLPDKHQFTGVAGLESLTGYVFGIESRVPKS